MIAQLLCKSNSQKAIQEPSWIQSISNKDETRVLEFLRSSEQSCHASEALPLASVHRRCRRIKRCRTSLQASPHLWRPKETEQCSKALTSGILRKLSLFRRLQDCRTPKEMANFCYQRLLITPKEVYRAAFSSLTKDWTCSSIRPQYLPINDFVLWPSRVPLALPFLDRSAVTTSLFRRLISFWFLLPFSCFVWQPLYCYSCFGARHPTVDSVPPAFETVGRRGQLDFAVRRTKFSIKIAQCQFRLLRLSLLP